MVRCEAAAGRDWGDGSVVRLPSARGSRKRRLRPPAPTATAAPPSPAARNSPESGGEMGLASWYGHPYHGRASASGEIYDMEQMTAAHRTLPFGTLVRVHDLDNEKTVDVRINDRGPFVDGRIIDLSHAAARAIEMIGPGTAHVRLEILSAPPTVAPAHFGVQVGAFRNRDNAERLRRAMEAQYGRARLVAARRHSWLVARGGGDGTDRGWRVGLGESHPRRGCPR